MDLVKLVTEQLSGDSLRSLGSLIGADSESTRQAATAAVPALLSGLAGMAQSDDGARKLASTINNLETSVPGGLGALGNLAGMLGGDAGGDAGSVSSLGGRLLSSLFGDSVTSGISNAVGRFAGLDASLTKKLLAWLLPLVLGAVGSKWKSQGGSIGGLASLFAEQKQNIARAIPSGFNLASIPGLPGVDGALRVAGQSARAAGDAATDVARRTGRAADEGSRTALSWLWPLLALVALLGALWFFFGRGPRDVANKAANQAANTATTAANTATDAAQRTADKVTALRPQLPDVKLPDITAITKDVSGIFASAKQSLGGITDAASAQAALPDLQKLSSRIDEIRSYFDRLPAAAQATLGNTIGKQFASLQAEADRILAMPGISPQVQAAVEGITNKLYGLNVAQVSQDATGLFTSLTKTLEGFRDAASAEAALPDLKEVSDKLDNLGRVKAAMPPGGQTMLSKLVTAARGPLEQLITKVLTQLGADAVAVKPVLDQIVDRVASLAEPPGRA